MGRREEKTALTQQQILSAAASLFTERGFQSTTLEDITEKANVSKGTFYYHFDSKEDLVVELRRWALADTVARAYEQMSEGRDPLWVLEQLLLDRAAFTEKHPDLSKVFFTQRIQHVFFREENSIQKPEEPKPKRRFLRKAIYEIVCEGQKIGQFRADLSPQEVAGMISAFFLHAQGAWIASDRTVSLVEKVHRWLHALLDGVGAKGYRDQLSCYSLGQQSIGSKLHESHDEPL